jgi:outer membrane protein assembly factor BamA
MLRHHSLFGALFCVLLSAAAAAQQPSAPAAAEAELSAIEVTGAKGVTRDDVAKLSGLTPGRPVRLDALQGAAERLARSGFFEKVEYRYLTKDKKLTVTFDIVEADRVVPVIFDNFVWFSDAQLVEAVREELPSFDGRVPQNEDIPVHISRALQKLMESRKIAGSVSFLPQTVLGSNSLQFIFKVDNPSPRICAVAFEGVSSAPLRELASDVTPLVGQNYSRFFVNSMTAATLIDTYRRLGYWRASFSPPVTTVDAPGCAGVSVTLAASEGAVYSWQSAEWKGNAALATGALDKLLGMRRGELADAAKINAALRQIAKEYGRQGYIEARTSLTPRLDDANKAAVFDIQVEEGRQFRMGSLEVVGFPERDAETISRRWRLKAGDVYDASYPGEFSVKELQPFRRPGQPPPAVQFEVDPSKGVINVRVVTQAKSGVVQLPALAGASRMIQAARHV